MIAIKFSMNKVDYLSYNKLCNKSVTFY